MTEKHLGDLDFQSSAVLFMFSGEDLVLQAAQVLGLVVFNMFLF